MRKISIENLLNAAEAFDPNDQQQVEAMEREQVALEELMDSLVRISTEDAALTEYDNVLLNVIASKKSVSVEELRVSSESLHPVLMGLMAALIYVIAYVLGYMFGTWLYKKLKGSGKGRVNGSLDKLSGLDDRAFVIETNMIDEKSLSPEGVEALEKLKRLLMKGPIAFSFKQTDYPDVIQGLTTQAGVVMEWIAHTLPKFKETMKTIINLEEGASAPDVTFSELDKKVITEIRSLIKKVRLDILDDAEISNALTSLRESVGVSRAFSMVTTDTIHTLNKIDWQPEKMSEELEALKRRDGDMENAFKVFEAVKDQLGREQLNAGHMRLAQEVVNNFIDAVKVCKVIIQLSCDYCDAIYQLSQCVEKLKNVKGKTF